jgi:hypothetical protein
MNRRSARWAVVLVGTLLVGCQSMQQPEVPEALPQAVKLSDEMDVGPSGGSLRCGPYSLVIPPGALAGTVHISMRQVTPGAWPVDLEPHGTEFAVPAVLTFDAYSEEDPASMTVQYQNPKSNAWENWPTKHDGTMCTAMLPHFSRWKIN